MKEKLIRYSICVLFILILLFPITSGLNNQNNESNDRAIIIFDSILTVSYDVEDTEQTITPIEDTLKIDIFIEYGIKPIERLLHKLIFKLYEGKWIEIDVEIDDASLPDYVSASIPPNQVYVNITQELTSANNPVVLLVKFNENAPAFIDIPIPVKVSVPEVIGRFGFTKIKDAEASVYVIVQPSYAELIEYNFPEGNTFDVSPNSKTMIPISITNLGNGPTNVSYEIINTPKGWKAQINESIILEVGEENTTYLTVKTDEIFNRRETILLRVSSAYSLDPTYSGQIYTLIFTLTTNKEIVNENEIGVEIFVLIFVIIILVLTTIYILYWKKLK